MSKRIEETSDGLKIRDTETGNLAGSVSTVGKKAPTASPKTLDSQATLAESIEPSSVESSYQTYQEAKESTTEERRVCPNCEGGEEIPFLMPHLLQSTLTLRVQRFLLLMGLKSRIYRHLF